ncbi:MAG: enolase C-terminal domain-like protein [Acidobacteriota bacterium]
MPTIPPVMTPPAIDSDLLAQTVRLERLEILEVVLPQVESFRSAVGVRNERRAVYVRWHDGEGGWGIGECSCRPDPFFSGEFVAGARSVLSDFIFPALPAVGSVGDVERALSRVRGWPFTVSAVLDALFDLLRRRGGLDPLDAWPHRRIERIPVGISLGLFADPAAAVDRVAAAVDDGYRRVKLKIGPNMRRDTLEAIRAAYPDLYLGFDANGTFGPADLDTVASLAELTPKMIEQPFAPGRLDLCQDLKQQAPELGLCLDESLTELGMVAAAHRLGALDEVNIKPGRVGGVLETVRILEYCRRHGLPAWVGGMFESGVGRVANLRVAACLPEATAHDLSPSSRYFTADVVAHPIEMGEDGCIDLSDDRPVALDEANLERLLADRIVLAKSKGELC